MNMGICNVGNKSAAVPVLLVPIFLPFLRGSFDIPFPISRYRFFSLGEDSMSEYQEMANCWRKVQYYYKGWESVIDTFGLAYNQAYKTHKALAIKSKKDSQLKTDIAYSALGLITGPLTSVFFFAAKATTVTKFVEFMQGPTVAFVGTLSKSYPKPTLMPAISKDPFHYHTQMRKSYRDLFRKTEALLIKELEKVRINPQPGSAARLKAKLAKTKFYQEPPKYNQNVVRNELEKTMWSLWARGLIVEHCRNAVFNGPKGFCTVDVQKPGATVEERLTKLGVKIDGKPLNFGWETDINEMRKLVKWGKNFRPKIFG